MTATAKEAYHRHTLWQAQWYLKSAVTTVEKMINEGLTDVDQLSQVAHGAEILLYHGNDPKRLMVLCEQSLSQFKPEDLVGDGPAHMMILAGWGAMGRVFDGSTEQAAMWYQRAADAAHEGSFWCGAAHDALGYTALMNAPERLSHLQRAHAMWRQLPGGLLSYRVHGPAVLGAKALVCQLSRLIMTWLLDKTCRRLNCRRGMRSRASHPHWPAFVSVSAVE